MTRMKYFEFHVSNLVYGQELTINQEHGRTVQINRRMTGIVGGKKCFPQNSFNIGWVQCAYAGSTSTIMFNNSSCKRSRARLHWNGPKQFWKEWIKRTLWSPLRHWVDLDTCTYFRSFSKNWRVSSCFFFIILSLYMTENIQQVYRAGA